MQAIGFMNDKCLLFNVGFVIHRLLLILIPREKRLKDNLEKAKDEICCEYLNAPIPLVYEVVDAIVVIGIEVMVEADAET